jgi:DNA-binding GntR family transcriptional regulator
VNDAAAARRVYEHLKRRIVRWELGPGARLVEAELADELGVSRTPVREAIQRLKADGLVVSRGRRGTEVPEWTPRQIEEAQRARAHLESWSSRTAVDHLTPRDLELLRSLAAAMHAEWESESPDLDRIAELNIDFHAGITVAAGPAVSQLIARAIHLPILHKVFHSYSPFQIATALNEHDTIILALEARDPDWVEAIIKAHILAALPALLRDQEGG